jgi:hypothetical protein
MKSGSFGTGSATTKYAFGARTTAARPWPLRVALQGYVWALHYRGAPVAIALALRRESDDVFSDLSEYAEYASDTDDAEDYVRWLQKAEADVVTRIDEATTTALTDEGAEAHLPSHTKFSAKCVKTR